MEHVIELSNKYLIKFSDWGYNIDRLVLNSDGIWKRQAQKYCTTIDAMVQHLLKCELTAEELTSLDDIRKVLEQIRAEFQQVKINELA